jgi:hypothetical protein
MNYTPGPWKVSEYPTRQGRCNITNSGGVGEVPLEIAEAYPMGEYWDDETKANARLIASAPELLEALEQLVEHVHGTYAYSEPHMEKARVAIAKATGEQE